MRHLQLVGSVYRPDSHAAPDKSSERHDHCRAAPVSRLPQQKHRVKGNDELFHCAFLSFESVNRA